MSTVVSARAKGPLVWGDMDQAALDDAYDQSKWAANQEQVTGRRPTNSARALKHIAAPERRAYGPTEIEKLDIYKTNATPAPVAIYLHGGAWRRGRAADFAFQAEMFVKAGAHHVVVDFINVDDAKGDLMPMVDQVRRAVAWTWKNAASFGGDPNRIYLIGHSSGAHLAGCVAVTDWPRYGTPEKILAGVLLCSGIYDLAPVRLSKRSEYVNFTGEMENALSAQRHIDRLNAPLIVAYGTNESPEFQRQPREFTDAVRKAGKPVELIVAEGYNHFEIAETMGNPYGAIGRAALGMMGLAGTNNQ
ncbi:MAG: alpha/beta hydrolase [Xanthobacteraceae bacterium]